jgi:hypothetical protein
MQANTLANKFDFSGGQIENISRKSAVDDIISQETTDIDKLLLSCQEEILEKEASKEMGFVMSRY